MPHNKPARQPFVRLLAASPLKLITHRRSRGILVPRRAAAAIRSANERRATGAWNEAAASYARALTIAPELAHIWVQLGHARKEGGELTQASAAYRRAADIGTEGAEPHIHMGQVAKLRGDLGQAACHYLEALRYDPESLAAVTELMRNVDPGEAEGAQIVTEAARILSLDLPSARSHNHAAGAQIYLDISDLVSYFSHARLPTGIQRVQIELVAAILRDPASREVHACCYADARGGWTALPRDQFLAVASAAVTSDDRDDPDWRQAVISVAFSLAAESPIRFVDGDILFNVGTSWSERNYFLHLREARSQAKLAYIAMIYDLIPTFAPHWFPASLVRDYLHWLSALVDHADGYVAISEATQSDLLRVPNVDAPVAVLPLNADFRGGQRQVTSASKLPDHAMGPAGFALMVSTIEPRKNHIAVLDAWLQLADAIDEKRLPALVCVGGRGWMNDAVHARLSAHSLLKRKVILLHGIGDGELNSLYRDCQFTVYPSFYEGWGLPVTESLCYGKIPVVSRTSSLPEAGGKFAIYFDPAVPGDMAKALAPLIVNPAYRSAHEDHIRLEFRPESWTDLGRDAVGILRSMSQGSHAPRRMKLDDDVRYSFASGDKLDCRSGDRLRVGKGWRAPSLEGSGPIRPTATIRLNFEPVDDRRLLVRLSNLGLTPIACRLSVAGMSPEIGLLDGNMSRWIELASPPGLAVSEIAIDFPETNDTTYDVSRLFVSELIAKP